MKKYIYFLILPLLFSCQTDKKAETKSEAIPPAQWLSFEGNSSLKKNKKIVLVSGDEEYRSEEALPQLARILSTHHGFDCTVLFAQDPAHPGIVDPNFTGNIPGLDALDDADLMFIFTRFRALPDEQMQHFQDFLAKGKPVIGIRTATHAFNYKDTTHSFAHWGNYFSNKHSQWDGGFGRNILGNNWYTHHGHHKHQSTRGIFAPGAETHAITTSIKSGDIWGATDVYGVPLPLPGDAQPLVLGQVVDREGDYDGEDLLYGLKESDQKIADRNPANKNESNPNDPMMPVIWTKSYQIENGAKGMSMTSTLGASSDLLDEDIRRIFVNASYHLLDMPVPDNAKVEIVGEYNPTQFQFHKDEYWDQKNLVIKDL